MVANSKLLRENVPARSRVRRAVVRHPDRLTPAPNTASPDTSSMPTSWSKRRKSSGHHGAECAAGGIEAHRPRWCRRRTEPRRCHVGSSSAGSRQRSAVGRRAAARRRALPGSRNPCGRKQVDGGTLPPACSKRSLSACGQLLGAGTMSASAPRIRYWTSADGRSLTWFGFEFGPDRLSARPNEPASAKSGCRRKSGFAAAGSPTHSHFIGGTRCVMRYSITYACQSGNVAPETGGTGILAAARQAAWSISGWTGWTLAGDRRGNGRA